MIKQCLNELITKLEDFDIESCSISIFIPNDDSSSLNITIKKINNFKFNLQDYDERARYLHRAFKDNFEEDEKLHSRLMEANLKMEELFRLAKFIEEFKQTYLKTTPYTFIPDESFWKVLKSLFSGSNTSQRMISNYKYKRKK